MDNKYNRDVNIFGHFPKIEEMKTSKDQYI